MDSDNQNLASAFAAACHRWPSRTAAVSEGRQFSYSALEQIVADLASRYAQLGVARGQRVVCCVGNRVEFIAALAASWRSGAVHVGVDPQLTGAELSSVVELTGASTLIYEPSGDLFNPLEAVDFVRRRYPALNVILVTDHLVSRGLVRWTARPGARAVLGPAADADPSGASPSDHSLVSDSESAGPAPEDPAMIFISAGTTGTPKATIGFHGDLARRWQRLAGWLRFVPDDVHLVQLPLSYGFGLMMATAALLSGGRLVFLDRFTAEDALGLIGAEGITVLNGAPAHFKLILDRLDPARHRVDTLRLSVGTAALFTPERVNAIWTRLGVEFVLMYGSSEGVGVATADAADILRGAVGRPAPGSVAVVGPDRVPQPAGSIGELAFSRIAFPVRYWNAEDVQTPPVPPSPTNSPADWYYSGDLGRLDEEGRLYVYGRLHHRIDRGGIKIDPVEVEAALVRCPDVADAAVIGQLNPVLGEAVCACVAPASGRQPTLDGLRNELGRTLAPVKLPESLYLLEGIPRTRIGKVDLPRLREQIRWLPCHEIPR